MSIPSAPIPPDLDQASHELRQVLLRLNQYAANQVQRADPATRYGAATLTHLDDLRALLSAVEQYEQAALACIPPAPMDVRSLTPAQLLAYREADPVYRLGYARGLQRGQQQGQQASDYALSAYARHATLPKPTDCSDLVKRVRLLLNFHQDPTPLSATRLDALRQQLSAVSHDHFDTVLYGND